jgi:hypothetical protein
MVRVLRSIALVALGAALASAVGLWVIGVIAQQFGAARVSSGEAKHSNENAAD